MLFKKFGKKDFLGNLKRLRPKKKKKRKKEKTG